MNNVSFKFILLLFVSNILSLFLAVCSFYLLIHDKQEWGWFLFGALCAAAFPVIKNKTEKES